MSENNHRKCAHLSYPKFLIRIKWCFIAHLLSSTWDPTPWCRLDVFLKPHVLERKYCKSHANGSWEVGPLWDDWAGLTSSDRLSRKWLYCYRAFFSGMCAPFHCATPVIHPEAEQLSALSSGTVLPSELFLYEIASFIILYEIASCYYSNRKRTKTLGVGNSLLQFLFLYLYMWTAGSVWQGLTL